MRTQNFFKLSLPFLLLIFSQSVLSLPKTALVIGNSAYDIAPLSNPANDAKAMGDTLRDLGFEVDEYVDLDLASMDKAIRDFGIKLKQNRGLGLFFYAGHGAQIGGNNYLIPVGSGITAADEVRYKSINAEMVLKKMETAGNNFNIVIMDACRNNPFPSKFRSIEKGLARMDAPTGSIIAYATAPGSTAADGIGNNGLYTSHLLDAMKIPGLSVEEVFKQVRIRVLDESKGAQTPWESSSLTGHFEFIEQSPRAQTDNGTIPPPPPVFPALQKSHLQVIANITGATVYINNVKQGQIPESHVLYVQNLADNEVSVRLEHSAYPSLTKKIALKKGEWQQAYFEFLPIQNLPLATTLPHPITDNDTPKTSPTVSQVDTVNIDQRSDEKKDPAEISNFFKNKSSGIVATDITTQGHFTLNQNKSRSQSNIPITDILQHH